MLPFLNLQIKNVHLEPETQLAVVPGVDTEARLENVGPSARADPGVVRRAVRAHGVYQLEHADSTLRSNTDFMLSIITEYGDAARWLSDELKNDYNFMLDAIEGRLAAAAHASGELKSNSAFILDAMRLPRRRGTSVDVFYHADHALGEDPVFMAQAMQLLDLSAEYALAAGEDPWSSADFLRPAIRKKPYMAKFALFDEGVRLNQFLLSVAVEVPRAARYMAIDMQEETDVEWVHTAVRTNTEVFFYLDSSVQNAQSVMLALLQTDGMKLEEIARYEETVQGYAAYKELVLAAVQQNSLALMHANHLHKDDEDVVMTAVTKDGNALQFASARLQAVRSVVEAAVRENGYALKFAPAWMQSNSELKVLASQTDPNAAVEVLIEMRRALEVDMASERYIVGRESDRFIVRRRLLPLQLLTNVASVFRQYASNFFGRDVEPVEDAEDAEAARALARLAYHLKMEEIARNIAQHWAQRPILERGVADLIALESAVVVALVWQPNGPAYLNDLAEYQYGEGGDDGGPADASNVVFREVEENRLRNEKRTRGEEPLAEDRAQGRPGYVPEDDDELAEEMQRVKRAKVATDAVVNMDDVFEALRVALNAPRWTFDNVDE